MDLGLDGKVAIVTASASGIGAACAEVLAAEGARVVVSTDRNEDGGRAVVDHIMASGGDAFFHRCDVAHEDQIAALVAAAVERYGRLDVLVNNAGVQRFAAIESFDRETWDWIVAVNLTGPALAAKYAVPHLKAQGGGAIVNISSIHDVVTGPLMGAYPATKAGLCGLTRVLALELAPHGIRVNAVDPGYIETPMFMGDMIRRGDGDPRPFVEALEQTIAMRRIGQPREVATVVAFLASAAASYVNGATLLIDGGVSIQL